MDFHYHSPRRLDPFDFDVHHEDDLPDYEPTSAPEYNHGYQPMPLHTFYLRQMDRKLHMFVPYGPSTSVAYRVGIRSPRIFSKKPEVEVWRTSGRGAREEHVASMWFDVNGPLPWRPRAHFVHKDASGVRTHELESENIRDWTMAIGDKTYTWTLSSRPASMIFCEKNATQVIARFNFSAQGTAASGGAEAGDLAIYCSELSNRQSGIEQALCGLIVAIAQFRKMGRHYWNEGRESTA